MGDIDGARRLGRLARLLSIVSIVLGVVVIVVYVSVSGKFNKPFFPNFICNVAPIFGALQIDLFASFMLLFID